MTGTELILSPAPALQPAALFTPTPKAAGRVLEFFTAQINNHHTRKAYLNATRRFAAWCEPPPIAQLADVQAVHVAAFVRELQAEFTAPTVKQHLAALMAARASQVIARCFRRPVLLGSEEKLGILSRDGLGVIIEPQCIFHKKQ